MAQANVSVIIRAVILVAALALIAGFFMPWAALLGLEISGYNLAKLNAKGNLSWVIIALAAVTANLAITTKKRLVLMISTLLSGIAPLSSVAYVLVEAGIDFNSSQLIIEVLAPGAWLTIAASILLIIVASNFVYR